MTIQFPETKTTKDAIRSAIGQLVTFVIQGQGTACPTCSGLDYYDSVNNLSLNQFCPVCSGAYWLTGDISVDVRAHVRWNTGDESDFGVAGATLAGVCSITIASDALSETQVATIKEVRADDRILKIYRATQRGVPTRDRIRFILRETGKE